MPDQLQLRGGTTAEHTTFTGASKEVTIDTTKKTAVVHDASTAGGNPLMREDGANSALVNGSVTEPALAFAAGDADNGIYSPGADQVAVTTNGVERVEWGASEVVFNDGGENYDFRVEGDTNTALFFVDASTDRVGVGTASPENNLHIFTDTSGEGILVKSTGNTSNSLDFDANRSIAEGGIGAIRGKWNGTTVAQISFNTGSDTTNKDDGFISFGTESAASNGNANAAEKMRIDSSGRLLVGTSTTLSTTLLQVEGKSNDGNAHGGIFLRRGSAPGTNDALGYVLFGDNGSNAPIEIGGFRDGGTWTAGSSMPTRLVFSTTADGESSPTERMRIDSAGRVGVGMTPSADDSITDVSAGLIQTTGNIDIRYPGSTSDPAGARYLSFINTDTTIVANQPMGGVRWTGLDDTNPNSDTASILAYCSGNAGTHSHITFNNGGTERARIDSSGRLLVGTSSSINVGASVPAIIQTRFSGSNVAISALRENGAGILALARVNGSGNEIVSDGDVLGEIKFSGADGSDIRSTAAYIDGVVDGTPGANVMPGRLVFATNSGTSGASPTERMRIESTGRTGTYASAADGFQVSSNAAAGTTYANFVGRFDGGAPFGGTVSLQIWNNGNIQNTNNSYGAISDAKLKENIVDASSQWDDLKALQVRKYNFKEGQTHTQIGLIAQETELVSPGLVSESPDRDKDGNDLGTVTKSVNYSVLYMKAVKALQEAMERIETLEAKVSALEAN